MFSLLEVVLGGGISNGQTSFDVIPLPEGLSTATASVSIPRHHCSRVIFGGVIGGPGEIPNDRKLKHDVKPWSIHC